MRQFLSAPYLGMPQLSHYAAQYDWLFFGMCMMALFFMLPIGAAIIFFCIKYRAGSSADRSHRLAGTRQRVVELSWTLFPFGLTVIFFVWAARLYVDWATPPPGGLVIHVVAKQWMWKFQHPGGQREINTLHVPMGVAVRLEMISQDVIHSLFLPALRIKHDVLPGTYSTMWFKADKTGEYVLACTEFCGTDHSVMGGRLVVMEPAQYQSWLDQAGTDLSLAAAGSGLFRKYGCSGCHGANSTVHAPSLGGLPGSVVHTTDGRTLTADEQYIRDCILLPGKNRVAGFPPIMPSFQGQISEEDLIALIAYIRSLPAGARP